MTSFASFAMSTEFGQTDPPAAYAASSEESSGLPLRRLGLR